VLTLPNGENLRPDLVLIDDPQTAESSASPTQNVTREQLIGADILGMAGPGKPLAAVMPCTVINRGDCIDRLLDRSLHPLWRGERTRLLRSMPTDLDAWQEYFDLYRACAQREPPDYTPAHDYYRANRAELDAGAEASWPERRFPGEVSGIQHAMNLYARGRRAFMAEYQNDPDPIDTLADAGALQPALVRDRVNRLPRLVVPRECSRLTAMIDVSPVVLWYVVCAWDERFGGAVIDYGSWPQQGRDYFAAAEAKRTLSLAYPGRDTPGAVYAGLEALATAILGRTYPRDGGGEPLRVERCCVDAGDGNLSATVHQWARQSAQAAILTPSEGFGIGASGRPPYPRRGDRPGPAFRRFRTTQGRRP
jgi:hypothetical protein